MSVIGGVAALAASVALISACSVGRANRPRSGTTTSSMVVSTTLSFENVTLPSGSALTRPSVVTPPPSNGSGTTDAVAPTTRRRRPPGLNSPQVASRNLLDAWRDDDRPRALLYADSQAVQVLFERKWAPGIVDNGCRILGLGDPSVPGSLDEFECTYQYELGVVKASAEGNERRGYRITGAARTELTTTTEFIEGTTTRPATTTTTVLPGRRRRQTTTTGSTNP